MPNSSDERSAPLYFQIDSQPDLELLGMVRPTFPIVLPESFGPAEQAPLHPNWDNLSDYLSQGIT